MNQKKNLRFQETDQRIRDCFVHKLAEKDMGKITVQEICAVVGINRSSFYLHYPDVYALLEAVCAEVGRELFEEFGAAAQVSAQYFSREYLLVVLRHVQKHRVLYRAYVTHVGMHQIDRGYNTLLEHVFKPYFRRLGMESEHRMEYHFDFVRAGFFAVLSRWMWYDCAETPEEVADIILQTMAPVPADLPEMQETEKQA